MLRDHCAHARFVWNLAVEQQLWWHPGRGSAPGYLDQCRQLTEARAEYGWLRAGSQMVQQQALRDFSQAMANFFAGTHGKPSWRKAWRDEGFRIVAVKPEQVRVQVPVLPLELLQRGVLRFAVRVRVEAPAVQHRDAVTRVAQGERQVDDRGRP